MSSFFHPRFATSNSGHANNLQLTMLITGKHYYILTFYIDAMSELDLESTDDAEEAEWRLETLSDT